MSHLQERHAKNCLNCNAQVHGKYCHICGQENLEPYESLWHLITHFFQDITHFDGKFFSSLKYLLFKPGFLSREYMIGRRASYLNPIRMYVFTSAFFFLIFFNFFVPEQNSINVKVKGKTIAEWEQMDSVVFSKKTAELNNGIPMSRESFAKYLDSAGNSKGIHFTPSKYRDKAQYDSLLRSGAKKHNWFEKKLIYKEIEINEKYKSEQQQILNAFIQKLFHTFPQMFFISLPIFAGILKLLYIRRKQFYYVSHAIFGIHFYVLIFLMQLLFLGIRKLGALWQTNLLEYISMAIVWWIFVYLYKSMRVFYGQNRKKTVFKYFLLIIAHFIVMLLLFLFFMFFSLMKV